MSEVERVPLVHHGEPSSFVLASDYDKLAADRTACFAEFKVMTRACLDAEKERDTLRTQLSESQANDRCAMAYLADVRAIVGGTDFVCMVHNVTKLHKQLDEARKLLVDSFISLPTDSWIYGQLDAWLEANKP